MSEERWALPGFLKMLYEIPPLTYSFGLRLSFLQMKRTQKGHSWALTATETTEYTGLTWSGTAGSYSLPTALS